MVESHKGGGILAPVLRMSVVRAFSQLLLYWKLYPTKGALKIVISILGSSMLFLIQ